jgi:uracil-DNA glycosylase
MIKEINLQEIRNKIVEKIKLTDWYPAIGMYLHSEEFLKLLNFLLIESQEGRRFVPELKYVFNAFEQCSLKDLSVVFVGYDPYPQILVPDGLCFSCSRQPRVEKSLDFMFKELILQYPNASLNPDLKHWANQGILLFNSSLTTRPGKPGAHSLIWKEFTILILDYLAWNKPDLLYVFFGKNAQEFAKLVPDSNYKKLLIHPAAAAHNHSERWDSQNLFVEINEMLLRLNKKPINW